MAVADTIAWANDLASAAKELAEGHENLVGVVARETPCDLHEAAATVRVMLDERMDDFDAVAAALPITVSRGTAGRGHLKAAILRTVLYLLCGAPLDQRDAPPPTAPDQVTTFTSQDLWLTAVAGLAFLDNARLRPRTRRMGEFVASWQAPDGGWGQHGHAPSDVLSTAQALPVVVRHGERHSAGRALAYLLAHQDPEGEFTSLPDQLGPRPLPFDFPVLADIHTLSAFQRVPPRYV